MNPTIWLVIAAIYTGLLIATGIPAVVIYDLIALRRGWRTVSGEMLTLGNRYIWVAVLTSGILGFIVGALCGHLFIGQVLQ